MIGPDLERSAHPRLIARPVGGAPVLDIARGDVGPLEALALVRDKGRFGPGELAGGPHRCWEPRALAGSPLAGNSGRMWHAGSDV